MLRITNLRCLTLDVDYIDIYWECVNGADPLDYSFRILRSEAQFGPFLPITKWFSDKYHYRDYTALKRSLVRHFYYKIEVKKNVDSSTEVFPPDGLPGESVGAKPDLVALEISRIARLKLKQFEGRKVWLLPRKTFGARCTKCYDQVTQQQIRSNCGSCSPVECYMSISEPQNTVQATDLNKLTPIKGTGRLSNYPVVNEDDVVVEGDNTRWRVFGVSNTSKNRALIRQNFGLEAISPNDMAYKIPLRIDLSSIELSEPREFTNPQSLDGTSPSDKTYE
jgi:hypothetical protein